MAKIKADDLTGALKEILEEFGDEVFSAVNHEGLDAAEKTAIEALAAASPVGKTGKFSKGWTGTGKTYKMVRFVGNTKTVSASTKLSVRSGDGKGKVPLTNILEYSTTRGKPFVKDTFERNADKIATALVDAVTQKLT